LRQPRAGAVVGLQLGRLEVTIVRMRLRTLGWLVLGVGAIGAIGGYGLMVWTTRMEGTGVPANVLRGAALASLALYIVGLPCLLVAAVLVYRTRTTSMKP
jgi:hypothetical protein